jgi:hypothetical protein
MTRLSLVALVVAAAALAAVAHAAVPAKVDWPVQFDVEFSLSIASAGYHNRTSHFYYDWTRKAQRISYPEGCVPLFPSLTNVACDMVFNNNGTYLMAPALGVDCCLMFPGIGASFPQALKAFTFNGTESNIASFDGEVYDTNRWYGSGFEFWTAVEAPNRYVKFRDGAGDTFWRFAQFQERVQYAPNFAVPDACATRKCPKSL